MKKLLSRIILSFLYFPFISSHAKADFTNTSVQSLSSSDCANISVLTLANHAANDGPDANHTLNNCNVSHTNALIRGLEIDNAIEDLTISNDSDIATNSSNISSNDTDITTNSSNISSNDTDISGLQSLISTKSGSTTTTRIGGSTKNILEIGPTTNPTTINQSGISVSGGNLIKKDSDGNIHIGKNSFVIGNEVLNGAHPIWAEDENGSKIPLNIYGSDLQINGVSVQGQIDTNKSNIKNLGSGIASSTALTAALTALPQTSKESQHSCGIGSGAYSGKYAVGFGCASKVNERVDINAGGSYVFGGAKSYGEGTLDNGVVKAGFVFKLGELNKPTQISLDESKDLKKEVKDLKAKNDEIISQNQKLLARLEKLENIALKFQSSSEMISVATKD